MSSVSDGMILERKEECNVRKGAFLAIVCSQGVIFWHCRLGKNSNLNEMDRWPNGRQIVNSHTHKTDHYTLEPRDAFMYPLQSNGIAEQAITKTD